MVRTKQGGSVLSFIMVGIVLLAIFAGGAFAVRQYMRPTQGLPTELPGERSQEKPQPEEKPSEQSPPADKKDDSPQKEEAKQPQKDTGHETAPRSETADRGEAALPKTGPSQLLVSLFAAGLLSAAGVSYLRSRRPELSL